MSVRADVMKIGSFEAWDPEARGKTRDYMRKASTINVEVCHKGERVAFGRKEELGLSGTPANTKSHFFVNGRD
jgi:hypothetical protein